MRNRSFNAFAGLLGVQTGAGDAPTGASPTAATATLTGGATGFTALIMCSSNLPDKVAIALDVQMDDGLLTSGFVRGVSGANNVTINATAGNAAASYAETGTNFYTLCRQF